MNATQTLIIDLIPSQGSSVTACVSTSSQLSTFCSYAFHKEQPHSLYARSSTCVCDRHHSPCTWSRMDICASWWNLLARLASIIPGHEDWPGKSCKTTDDDCCPSTPGLISMDPPEVSRLYYQAFMYFVPVPDVAYNILICSRSARVIITCRSHTKIHKSPQIARIIVS